MKKASKRKSAQSSGPWRWLFEEGHVDHDDGSCWRKLQGGGDGGLGTGYWALHGRLSLG